MENQLVTIEQANEITALSTESGVKGIVQQAKEAIHNLDGGSMKTAVGRKKIRSNAFKATKLKTSLKERAEELIDSIEKKIAPELKTIQAIKENQKVLGSDLDKLRKDVNSEVDDHEKELQRIADEDLAKEKAIKDAEEKDLLWDFALMELKVFNIELAAREEKRIADEVVEKARLKQVQIDNDIRIAAAATVEAERVAQEKIDTAKIAEQKAIDDKIKADAELLAAQAREKLLSEQAEQTRINNEWLSYISEAYEYNEKLNAEARLKYQQGLAEVKRLAAIETERLAGIERQRLQDLQKKEAQDKLEANEKYVGSVRGEIKLHLMNTCGIDEELAVSVVKALLKIKTRVTINY